MIENERIRAEQRGVSKTNLVFSQTIVKGSFSAGNETTHDTINNTKMSEGKVDPAGP